MTRRGRKRKVYDDKALALALAHQTKTTTQIAHEFGLSQWYVIQLRKGRYRPRLQRLIREIHEQADDKLDEHARLQMRALLTAHIRAALTGTRGVARRCREYLLDRYLLPETHPAARGGIEGGSRVPRGGFSPAREGPTGPRGGRYRKKFYDEEALVRDLAEERLSLRQIARKHQLSRQFVGCISQGTERPDLAPRIDELRRAILDEGSRMMTPWIKCLLAQEIRYGVTQENDTARLCRHYILDRFLPPRSDSEAAEIAKRAATRRRRLTRL